MQPDTSKKATKKNEVSKKELTICTKYSPWRGLAKVEFVGRLAGPITLSELDAGAGGSVGGNLRVAGGRGGAVFSGTHVRGTGHRHGRPCGCMW